MCLAVPARLTSCQGSDAVADLHGNQVPISIMLVPNAVPGDWVLVHAGFAIQKLTAQDVEETFAVTGRAPAQEAGPQQQQQP